MENIENVSLFVKSLDDAADQLNTDLEPVLKKSLDELIANASSNAEKIKIYNTYSYVLISTIYSYLKAIGINTDKHPVMKELNRIKSYMKRFKDFESNVNKKDTTKEDAEKAKAFLTNTLGTKVNGGGAAQTTNLTTPAISSSNFRGVHKKFDESKSEDENESKESKNYNRKKKISSSGKIQKTKGSKRKIAKGNTR